jgi:peptidoglycan/LPS O-acetylase OafA/YrhL
MENIVMQEKIRTATSNYMPQLDGIRAVAILCVLIAHFLPPTDFLNRIIHFGRLGVIMFFVLSGFLITGILLRYKEQSLKKNNSTQYYLRKFYVRRVLRIFPIYYLTIAIAIIVGYDLVRQYWVWHILYISNLAAGYLGINFGAAIHLWSLCVEEQFYLVWPAVVLLSSKKSLPQITILMIIGSIAYKFIGGISGLSWTATNFTTPGCLDSLGLGAMLAILRYESSRFPQPVNRFAKYSLIFGLPLCLALQIFWFVSVTDVKQNFVYQGFVDLGFGLLAVALVHSAANNSALLIGRVLQSRPLIYVGKISYGIYLYHYFLLYIIPSILSRFGISIPFQGYGILLAYSAISILLATISWNFIEKPINKLKDHFAPDEKSLGLQNTQIYKM